MSDSQEQPWSDNPNAPKIPYGLYLLEKTWFAGTLISSILYGVLIVLFFNCMAALFNPAYRRGEGIKWRLVIYTVIMFSLVTVYTAIKDHILSICYIDNREFADYGPWGYHETHAYSAIFIIARAAFNLNNWLADGLLLYRCYLFYSANIWVIAFPVLMYLGSVATGILANFSGNSVVGRYQFYTVYISLSLALNVLLTCMIVVRLVLYSRSVRTAMGSSTGIGELYKSIATMLVESSALFTVSSVLVIGPWAAGSAIANVFVRILAETQVIASLLIIQRVADKSAFTSETLANGSATLLKARARGELTDDSGGYPTSSVEKYGRTSGDAGIGVETMIDIRQDKVWGFPKSDVFYSSCPPL